MLKVLHILSSLNTAGGVQRLIWNYYNNIDNGDLKFDFVVFDSRPDGFEKHFIKKGCKINLVTPKRQGIFKHCKELYKVLKSEKYDIVHVHQDYLGWTALFLAWILGVKTRIIHTHKANLKESFCKKLERFIFTKITYILATDFFACGIEAAKWTFGEKRYEQNKVYILNNAIEIQKYAFDEQIRQKVRNEFDLTDKKVIGNVARFTFQKNQHLLIEIFEKLYKNDSSYRLMLVGDGENFEEIKNIVESKGLKDLVLFLGCRDDVPELLSAMDIFVLTSRFEGLPLSLVEAQANGLYCVVSSNTTKEANITGRISYINDDNNINEWSITIDKLKEKGHAVNTETLKKAGLDIVTEAHKLQKKYVEILSNRHIKYWG